MMNSTKEHACVNKNASEHLIGALNIKLVATKINFVQI
jgi:hypothetical protein